MKPEEELDKLFKNFIDIMYDVESFRSDTDSSYIGYEFQVKEMINWAKREGDDMDKEGIELFEKKLINLPKFSKLIHSMTMVYAVSKFETYLNDCLNILINWNPSSLKSSKQMSYKEIFEFSELADLFENIKEREILEFSFSSFNEKLKILEKKFNLIFTKTELKLETITEILTTRNIHLHNGGYINEAYLNNNRNSTCKIGEEKEITIEYTIHVIAELMRAGECVYRKIKEKIVVQKI